MITERERRTTGTLAALGAVLASGLVLIGCSSTPTPKADPAQVLEAAMVTRHPDCAGRTTMAADGGGVCTVEGHVYVVYLTTSTAKAAEVAGYARTLHPTGTVEVAGLDVWVTE